jgi:hypothetical protein
MRGFAELFRAQNPSGRVILFPSPRGRPGRGNGNGLPEDGEARVVTAPLCRWLSLAAAQPAQYAVRSGSTAQCPAPLSSPAGTTTVPFAPSPTA